MAHVFARLWNRYDSNWRPWSVVVVVCEQPKRDIQPERRARDPFCCDLRDGEGFRPARETVYISKAVMKSCRIRKRVD